MSANSIYNLIRALSRPYLGAHFENNGKEVKVFKVKIIKNKNNFDEPGKIIGVKKAYQS